MGKVAFGAGEKDPLQLNHAPFFLPSFDSSGGRSGGLQVDLSNMVLDASAVVADKPYQLTIALQGLNGTTSHEVNLDVTPAKSLFYITPDRIVVPAQSPVVSGDGPYITVKFLEGQFESAPLVGWTVGIQQGDRKWSETTSMSGIPLSTVELQPIKFTVTNPVNSQAFTYVAYPAFRGGQPGLVTYDVFR